MSLNWNAGKCPALQPMYDWYEERGGYDNMTKEQREEAEQRFDLLWAVRDDMIWSMVAVKMGSITADNAEEYAMRLWTLMRMGDWSPVGYKKQDGSFLGRKDCASYEEVYERVLSFVGLSANVTTESRAAFWKSLRRLYEDDAASAHRRMMSNREVTA